MTIDRDALAASVADQFIDAIGYDYAEQIKNAIVALLDDIERQRGEPKRRAKIESFRALGPNWDSYGCEAFSHESIDAALALERMIPIEFDSIIPIAGGGVMFGKNGDEVTVEIFATHSESSATGKSGPDYTKETKPVPTGPARSAEPLETPRTNKARLTIEERRRFARGDGVLYELVRADFARQLERELSQAREQIAEEKEYASNMQIKEQISYEKLASAEQQLAEYKKDAERYRWLRDRRITGKGIPCLAYFRGVLVLCDDMSSTDVDSAIDAAIAQER